MTVSAWLTGSVCDAQLDRRAFLALLAAGLGAACRRTASPAIQERSRAGPSAAPAGEPFEVRDWQMGPAFGTLARCVVLVPRQAAARRTPLLVALHGAGETVDPRTGAHGWLDSYALGTAYRRLLAPPLVRDDLRGLVTPARLETLNAELRHRPFGGLVVACPYVPRSVGREVPVEVYGRWLGEVLLPRLRRETPASSRPSATGIDGVSFGGALALRLGLARPELFGAIGTLQPALHEDEIEDLAVEIGGRLAGRPLRLVTSTEDQFRHPVEALHAALERRRIPHQQLLTEGPHSYRWNRGPGAVEMLLWHDRVLAEAVE
jgi:enterochelin esterase-like enzyme